MRKDLYVRSELYYLSKDRPNGVAYALRLEDATLVMGKDDSGNAQAAFARMAEEALRLIPELTLDQITNLPRKYL